VELFFYFFNFLIPYFSTQAQAIMSLAGKVSSPTHNNTLSTAQLPSPCNGLMKNQSQIITMLPGISNPLTSQACSQSGVGTSSTNELVTVKPTGTSPFSTNHSETPKAVNLAESTTTTLIPTGTTLFALCTVYVEMINCIIDTLLYKQYD
jgi:hypothetical protein